MALVATRRHAGINYLQTESVSAVQATANWLRDRVLNAGLAPDEQLTEAEVAEQRGVSRPTARNAITILVNNGLLRRDANKPAYVPRLSRADVEDLFLVRVPLELEVVTRVIRNRLVPRECAKAVEDMLKLNAHTLTSEFVETDLRFHRLLVESIGSPRLTRLYEAILGEIHLSMVQSQKWLGPELIAQEHGAVLAALEEGNEPIAHKLMREHLEGACARIAAKLTEKSV